MPYQNVMEDRFFKGTLTFAEAPDAEELSQAIEVRRASGCQMELVPHDGDADTVYRFGMRGLGSMPDWLCDLVRTCSQEEERVELFLDYCIDDMRRFFNCEVECTEFRPRMGEGGDIELAAKLCDRRPSFMREQAGRPRRAERADVGVSEDGGLDEALGELDAMIGLGPVKRRIHDIASIVQNRGADALPCMHMVFTGNPGTGKTKVARILARVLKSLGALRTGTIVETDRSGLVGEYVGHTAVKAKAVIDSAKGGVLFIDEAYSLGLYAGDLGAGPDGHGGRRDFGPEAIDALVKEMEGGKFVCVMAGYPREMEIMLSCNPGLRDRVGFYIDFPDYSTDELCEIFAFMVAERGYELTEGAAAAAGAWISGAYEARDADFGNARLIRRLVDRVLFEQNVRTAGTLVEACDVEAAIADSDLAALAAARNGSANPIGFAAC